MSGLRTFAARALAPAAAVLASPALARACAVCSVVGSEKSRKAFFDTTILLSLLPLGLIVWGLVWVARRGREAMRDEFADRDEVVPGREPERAPRREPERAPDHAPQGNRAV